MIEVEGEGFESVVQMEQVAKARRMAAQRHHRLAEVLDRDAQTLERAIEAEKSKPEVGDLYFNFRDKKVGVITEYLDHGLVIWVIDESGKAYFSPVYVMGDGWEKVTRGGSEKPLGNLIRETLRGDKNV